jgi:hypothetical protein
MDSFLSVLSYIISVCILLMDSFFLESSDIVLVSRVSIASRSSPLLFGCAYLDCCLGACYHSFFIHALSDFLPGPSSASPRPFIELSLSPPLSSTNLALLLLVPLRYRLLLAFLRFSAWPTSVYSLQYFEMYVYMYICICVCFLTIFSV